MITFDFKTQSAIIIVKRRGIFFYPTIKLEMNKHKKDSAGSNRQAINYFVVAFYMSFWLATAKCLILISQIKE